MRSEWYRNESVHPTSIGSITVLIMYVWFRTTSIGSITVLIMYVWFRTNTYISVRTNTVDVTTQLWYNYGQKYIVYLSLLLLIMAVKTAAFIMPIMIIVMGSPVALFSVMWQLEIRREIHLTSWFKGDVMRNGSTCTSLYSVDETNSGKIKPCYIKLRASVVPWLKCIHVVRMILSTGKHYWR